MKSERNPRSPNPNHPAETAGSDIINPKGQGEKRMEKNKTLFRVLAVLLTVTMLFGLMPMSVFAAGNGKPGFTVEKVDGVGRLLHNRNADDKQPIPVPEFAEFDTVRVSIVLDEAPLLEAGFAVSSLASDTAALNYRSDLRSKQDIMADRISAKALGGKKLDVVWKLTLAADIISANVKYGQINAIKKVPGVSDVIVETRHEPDVVRREADNPNMSTASDMTGGTYAWAQGYTGAGSVIAIVDTGLDTAHRSFDPGAFEYALAQTGKDVDLLTKEEVAKVWKNLNIADRVADNEAYLSSKVPFAANYVDSDFDVTHANDVQGEHGSHVAGIAAANRYVPDGKGGYENALSSVLTQGEAPDAQLIVMKVFGKGGGAYDSDYMVAIEDAIMLGADVVNLSLGSGNPGFTTNELYAEIMDKLADSGMVWANSAGNSFSWPNSANFSYLYGEDVSMSTAGSPGVYPNTLGVASVDNRGYTGEYFKVGENLVFYTQSEGYGNAPISSIPGEYKYVLIDDPGVADNDYSGNTFAALGKGILEGKIAVCKRGSSSFFAKANAAVEQGAVAVIIFNNTAGSINMNLTGYKYKAPAVSITEDEGYMMMLNAEEKTANDVVYYEGTLTISQDIGTTDPGEQDYYIMSDFSSWGVPGDLTLKPEITAPGGNIYSVFGTSYSPEGNPQGGPDKYENLSGTSMASPQIAGVTAVMAQYIRENGLVEKTGLTQRQLIHSLLMSTAEPLFEEESSGYYSVMKQGAGLVNINAAMNAKSFIMMDETATASAADGKIKVELGDDPDRQGTYGATFTVTNMSDAEVKYKLSSKFFTQDLFEYYLYDGNGNPTKKTAYYMDTWTTQLSAREYWFVDGESSAPILSLGAGESAEVILYFKLTDVDTYDLNGAYIEGYIFVEEAESADGAKGVTHSIPVLGYYGSWTESSMFDHGGYLESQYEELDNGLEPYMNAPLGVEAKYVKHFAMKYAGGKEEYSFGGNPEVPDETYFEERNAMNASDTLSSVSYTLLRNAGAGRFTVENDKGENLFLKELGPAYSAYYYVNGAVWRNTSASQTIGFTAANAEEGDRLTAALTYAPEYYTKGESVEWDALGDGATMSISWTVDNTDPVIDEDTMDVHYNVKKGAFTSIDLDVTDNLWIAAVALFDEEENLLGVFGSELDTGAGETVSYTFELPEDVSDHLYIQAFDYADNYVTYKINLDRDDLGGEYSLSLDEESIRILRGTDAKLTATAEPWGSSEEVVWTSSDESIVTVDEKGVVTGVGEGFATVTATSVEYPDVSASAEVEVFVIKVTLTGALQDEDGDPMLFTWDLEEGSDWNAIGDLETGMTAMSYDWLMDDGQYLYQQDWDGFMYQIDAGTLETVAASEGTTKFGAPVEDFDFAYYYNLSNDNRAYDFTGDGIVDDADVQALLDYVVLGWELTANEEFADIDFDGDVDTYDAYQMLPYVGYPAPHRAVGVEESYLLYSEDVMANTFTSGYPLGQYLSKYTGASKLVAVTWDYGDEEGDEFIALDDSGTFWVLTMTPDGGLGLAFIETDLSLSYPLMEEVTAGNSLVMGDDGNFYLAHYNGNTSEIYQLVYDAEQELFVSTRIGDVGDGVWPAVLINVTSNEEAEADDGNRVSAPARAIASGKSLVPAAAPVAVLNAGDAVEFGSVSAEDGLFARNGRETASIQAVRGIGTNTVDLYANEDTTNGQIEVSFGGAVLTDITVNAEFCSIFENKDGLLLGFVNSEAIPMDGVIAELTFADDSTSSVRFRFTELNDVNPYEGEDELNLDLVITELETATYNPDANEEDFVTYAGVPEGCRIEVAGIVAAREADFDSEAEFVYHTNVEDDKDPEGYFSRGFDPGETALEARYTWTKTAVVKDSIDEEGNGWYVKSFLRYTYNGVTRDAYGDLIYIKPGTDYDVDAGVAVELETAIYNPDTNEEDFVTYGTVPEGSTIQIVGIVAAREASYPASGKALEYRKGSDPENFFSRGFDPGETAREARYTWTKTAVVTDSVDEEGNGWYVKAFMRYTRGGRTIDVYGDEIYVKPGTDFYGSEDLSVRLESAAYDADANEENFVIFGNAPEGYTVEFVGLAAAREAAYENANGKLVFHNKDAGDADPDGFFSRGFNPGSAARQARYTWTKTAVVSESIDEEGNGWYIRPYLRYTRNGRTVEAYGDLIYVKPGTDYAG